MNEEEKGRVIGALVAVLAIMGALGWYLGARDGIVADLKAWNEDYAKNHSMISRQLPPDHFQKEARWRVVWQCAGEPKMGRVVYAVDGKRAIKSEKQAQRGKKGCVFDAALTILPYCGADRQCGAASVIR